MERSHGIRGCLCPAKTFIISPVRAFCILIHDMAHFIAENVTSKSKILTLREDHYVEFLTWYNTFMTSPWQSQLYEQFRSSQFETQLEFCLVEQFPFAKTRWSWLSPLWYWLNSTVRFIWRNKSIVHFVLKMLETNVMSKLRSFHHQLIPSF